MDAKSGIWMGVRKEKKKRTIEVLCQQRVKRSGVTGKDAQNSDRWRSKLGGRNANMNFCDVLHACIGGGGSPLTVCICTVSKRGL